MWIYKCWKTAFSKIKPAIRENTSSGKRQWCGGEEGNGVVQYEVVRWQQHVRRIWLRAGSRGQWDTETEKEPRSVPLIRKLAARGGLCVLAHQAPLGERGGSASQSINHTAPKNLANLWPVCHTGCALNKAVCPPHSPVWGCNMRRRRNHGAFSGGNSRKQDYALRNAMWATRKYTPNTLKYLRGIETQRTIFANQMGLFRDTRWTSAHAELNTHTCSHAKTRFGNRAPLKIQSHPQSRTQNLLFYCERIVVPQPMRHMLLS